jgi:3-hydroxyacyl-[acyl-carrier-protein] dehydratase
LAASRPAALISHRRSCGSASRQRFVARAEAEAAPAAEVPLERSGNNFTALKDIEAIKKVLPHRFPFLLVDRVVECEFQKYAVGYKNITMNDNFFTGHFPERAIMPGVLQVEAMAQLGGIVMLDPEAPSKEQFFFGGIEKCRFKKPVVPGDTLMMRVDVTKYNKRFGIVKMSAKAYVGPDIVCEAELTLAMGS